jgi:hypothetical protein
MHISTCGSLHIIFDEILSFDELMLCFGEQENIECVCVPDDARCLDDIQQFVR